VEFYTRIHCSTSCGVRKSNGTYHAPKIRSDIIEKPDNFIYCLHVHILIEVFAIKYSKELAVNRSNTHQNIDLARHFAISAHDLLIESDLMARVLPQELGVNLLLIRFPAMLCHLDPVYASHGGAAFDATAR